MKKKNVLPFANRQIILTVQFAFLLFFLTTIQVSGKVPFQQNFIHGHVTDSSGRALSGVSVLVKGTKGVPLLTLPANIKYRQTGENLLNLVM